MKKRQKEDNLKREKKQKVTKKGKYIRRKESERDMSMCVCACVCVCVCVI